MASSGPVAAAVDVKLDMVHSPPPDSSRHRAAACDDEAIVAASSKPAAVVVSRFTWLQLGLLSAAWYAHEASYQHAVQHGVFQAGQCHPGAASMGRSTRDKSTVPRESATSRRRSVQCQRRRSPSHLACLRCRAGRFRLPQGVRVLGVDSLGRCHVSGECFTPQPHAATHITRAIADDASIAAG